MPSFACTDAGATCKSKFSADSMEELVRQVSDHLQSKHKVNRPTQTLLNFVAKVAK